MSLTNLWEETINDLERHGLTWDDVVYVCGEHFMITKQNFEAVAKETNYDDGYGAPEVAEDLKICGRGWWLERGEYDGSEWWEFKTMPQAERPEYFEITKLAVSGQEIGWKSLRELNGYREC